MLHLALGFAKMAEYAPGIPDKRRFSPIRAAKNESWTYVLQAHKAERAGPHLDLRLGDPKTQVAHSFAFNSKGFPAPGQRTLVLEQPDHTLPYMKFKGRIEKGYGAGTVAIAQHGKARILDSEPGKIHFLAAGRRYVLVATPKYKPRSWLLMGLRGAPKRK